MTAAQIAKEFALSMIGLFIFMTAIIGAYVIY